MHCEHGDTMGFCVGSKLTGPECTLERLEVVVQKPRIMDAQLITPTFDEHTTGFCMGWTLRILAAAQQLHGVPRFYFETELIRRAANQKLEHDKSTCSKHVVTTIADN